MRSVLRIRGRSLLDGHRGLLALEPVDGTDAGPGGQGGAESLDMGVDWHDHQDVVQGQLARLPHLVAEAAAHGSSTIRATEAASSSDVRRFPTCWTGM